MIPFVKTKMGIAVYDGSKMVPIGTDHLNFSRINDLCNDTTSTFDMVKDLIDIQKTVITRSNGKIVIEDDTTMTYEGRTMAKALAVRVIQMVKEDKDLTMIERFMENLVLNPSYRAVEELYGFLEACSLPITADGCFLAYKKVKYDYMDIHSGTFDNSVGKALSMSRNMVDEDKNRTCSNGLHVCSFPYLEHFGGAGTDQYADKVVICKVNPRDVVSVPADYNNQKMRVCQYEVVDEIPNDGVTTLIDYCYGNRDVGYIRSVFDILRKGIEKAFNTSDIKTTTDIYALEDVITQYQIEKFFSEDLREMFPTLSEKATKEAFEDVYDELTMVTLLSFISNWSE